MSPNEPPPGRAALRRAVAALVVSLAIGAGVLGGAVVTGYVGPGTAARPTATAGASAGPGSSGSVATSAAPEPSPTVPVVTPPPPALVPAPLTGLPVTEEAARRHPIAVMVDDHADARPQAGFNAASVVWHAPAEGGVPRYMLVFQDRVPGDVGPIRSARQYYVEWAAEWRAMYVHHGGSPQALETLRARGLGDWVWNADGFRWEGRYVFRVGGGRFAPHNVMTDGEHLRALAERIGAVDGPLKPAWTFAGPRSPELRPTGARITATYRYETISYRYDAASNRYRRYIAPAGGRLRLQIDAADGVAVAPTNVVVMRMAFGPLDDGHPDKGRLEAHDVGTGVAWLSTNGVTVKGTWAKDSVTAPTRFFGPDGSPFAFAPGQTFIQVLALDDPLSVRAGAIPRQTQVGPGGVTAR